MLNNVACLVAVNGCGAGALYSGLDGTASLPYADLMPLGRQAAHTRSPESQCILDRAKEAEDLLPEWAHRAVPGQQAADAIENHAHVGQKGDQGRYVIFTPQSPPGTQNHGSSWMGKGLSERHDRTGRGGGTQYAQPLQ